MIGLRKRLVDAGFAIEPDHEPPPLQDSQSKKDKFFRARHACLKSASANIHRVTNHSLLDSRAPTQNYRGMYNLAGIVLIVTNLRLVVENLMKYGILVKVSVSPHELHRSWPVFRLMLLLPLFVLFAHVIEYLAWLPFMGTIRSKQEHAVPRFLKLSKLFPRGIQTRTGNYLHLLNALAAICLPTWVVWHSDAGLFIGVMAIAEGVVMWMKLVSYAHVMHADRRRAKVAATKPSKEMTEPSSWSVADTHKNQNKKGKSKNKNKNKNKQNKKSSSDRAADNNNDNNNNNNNNNNNDNSNENSNKNGKNDGKTSENFSLRPEDVTDLDEIDFGLRCLGYFMLAPTLCYQHRYPRYPDRIRVRFILRRVSEIIFCVCLVGAIGQQYVQPLMHNALKYMEGSWNWIGMLERVLKLSVPNMAMWLLMFYATFHSYLNLMAELLRFGDRVFYRDWWNARTLKDYWNRWNIPVHNWVLRHVYAPCMRAGYSRVQGQLAVFVLSAALHELLASAPLHSVKLWAFMGMMGQLPLIMITRKMNKYLPAHSQWGNVTFWCSFCVVGQPLVLLLYYQAFEKMLEDGHSSTT